MVNQVSTIFGISQQKFFKLLLFCIISLCLEDTVQAQQPNSASTPLQLTSSSPVEGNRKDVWDIVESTSGWGVAAIGAIATFLYNNRQQKNEKAQSEIELAVSRVQTISNLVPQLQSKYLEDVELAIKLVVALGDIELATDLLERYETGVSIPIFQRLVSNPNPKIAQQVEQSLKDYLKRLNLAEARERILSLVRKYAQINEKEKFSSERTWKMESIISEIRRYALVAFPLLPELTSNFCPSEDIVNSLVEKMKINTVPDYPLLPELKKPADSRDWSADGKRLAAVAILQVQPNSDYLDWLATILAREEGSFLGYHTAIALRNAVYSLGIIHYAELQRAIEFARKKALEIHGEDIENVLDKPPFREVLTQAEAALQRYLD
jgi:hypothetical protein